MKLRVKREMDKQSIDIVSLFIIVGKTRPAYQTMVKSRSNCFIISGCCVITGTGSNMVRQFGHYEMLHNQVMKAAILEQQEQLDYKCSLFTTTSYLILFVFTVLEHTKFHLFQSM